MSIKPFWEIKQAVSDPSTLELYIYGDVEGEYFDWEDWAWKRSDTSAEAFREALAKYSSVSQIDIYINSYGGSVFEGTAIYNQLRRHPAHKTVYIDGFACSIASVIAMAGDEVIMPENTLMMIHNMWMTASGSAEDLRKAADNLETINAAGRSAYLTKAGDKLDEARLIEMMDAETWLTARECVDLGLADRVAESKEGIVTLGAMVRQQAAIGARQERELKTLAAKLRSVQGIPEPAPADPDPANGKTPPMTLMQILGGKNKEE